MRFIDEATIRVSAGKGGPGCISFRRETFAPRGGPDGGDGGAGGDIIFIADTKLGTLQDQRFKRIYAGKNGDHGSGANKSGRAGEHTEIRIPVGTIIKDPESGEILVDMIEDGQTWVCCHGGRCGKGNAHFVSSTFQAPKFAQPGEEGEFKEITLELKLLADAAIIGFPNAGKSTLISVISAARPKIADYAFTTLTPNLGVVDMPEYQSFVIADTPGLIEGAHTGMGLGHRFLKHIERTRVFVHMLDGTKILEDATKPEPDSFDKAIDELVRRYEAIRNELGLYNEALLHKPEIVVLNKIDLLESDPDLLDRAKKALRMRIAAIRQELALPAPPPEEPFLISAASKRDLSPLKFAVYREIMAQKAADRRKSPLNPARKGMAPAAVTEDGVKLPDDEDLRK